MNVTPSGVVRHLSAFLLLSAASALAVPADPSLPHYVPETKVSGHLNGVSGMDSVEAMMAAWAADFKKIHPEANITMEPKEVGPEERIVLGDKAAEAFANDTLPFENTYGYEPFRVKIAMAAFVMKSHVSAIGVYVNKNNPLTQISLAQLDAIFSADRRRGYAKPITTWGQLGLGGEWADKPIHPIGFYGRDDVTMYFRKLVLFDANFNDRYRIPGETMNRKTPLVGKAIMAQLESDPSAISFGNASYKTDVKALAIVDDLGVISQFSQTDIASGRYPLERYLYFVLNRKPGTPLDPLIKEFLSFVLSKEGQDSVEKDHYLPLTPELASEERSKLN
jgi:phosphate transport system substrate-binding protein